MIIKLRQKLITVYELFRFYIYQSYLPLVTVLITAICKKRSSRWSETFDGFSFRSSEEYRTQQSSNPSLLIVTVKK